MTHQDRGLQRARDQLIATYFPDASPEEAEQHLADFRRFAEVMTRIATRLVREEEGTLCVVLRVRSYLGLWGHLRRRRNRVPRQAHGSNLSRA